MRGCGDVLKIGGQAGERRNLPRIGPSGQCAAASCCRIGHRAGILPPSMVSMPVPSPMRRKCGWCASGSGHRRPLLPPLFVVILLAVVGVVGGTQPAAAQEVFERHAELADRPISDVIVTGHRSEDDQFMRNNLRAAVGDPYRSEVVRGDVDRIYALGRFRYVTAEAELRDDGSVLVVYTVTPQPPVTAVDSTGNKAISDQEIRAIVRQRPGGPRDDYLIERAKRDIERLYRQKGYYLTSVEVDETELDRRGLLIFRIVEGPRVRIRAIEFRGAESFPYRRLIAEVTTRTYLFLLRPGVLDEDRLSEDVAGIDRFYKDRGYLDVRVDRTVELSPDNREAKVVFFVSEGKRFTLRSIDIVRRDGAETGPTQVFSAEQLIALMDIKPGDVYSADRIERAVRTIEAAYAGLGRREVFIGRFNIRTGPEPVVDLLLEIDEGVFARVGAVDIRGNFLTRDKVVRRQLRFRPGRPLDQSHILESQRRLDRLRLFNEARITVQPPDPFDPEYRDVLVEVKERNTGRVNFGVALGSDSGVAGEISVEQDNFDLLDFPETFRELVAGRAFRGGGQRFSMALRPGTEIFQYSVSLTEPNFLDSDYSLSGFASYRERRFRQYDEERITGSIAIGRTFGEVWQGSVRLRGENVRITAIDPTAPTELFLDRGPDLLLPIGVSLTRSTIGTRIRPGSGSRIELSLDNFGILGGDYDFWRGDLEYSTFLTLREDFLGRRSILRLTGRAGHIFGVSGRSPTYERFYMGGRSFRGYQFRTIAPKGVRADNGERSREAVGGEWLFFAGAQYEVPLFDETVTGVLFMDSGTVTDQVGFDDYRVSVGFGVRLYIPQLGPVPIAFDFGFPIRSASGDSRQLFSFSAELPY